MILLSDPLPLRRAADLPVWLDDAPLPWVYGRVTLAPVCISTDRREWLIADHAIAGVTSVAAAGEPVSGWQHLNRTDDSGRAIAVLRTSQPVKEGVQLAVACTGALDERSGEVIEHPAAIARDLLKRCGRDVQPDAFLGLHDAQPAAACGIVFDGGTLRESLAALFAPFDVLWNAADTRAVPLDLARSPVGAAITPRTAARAEAACALDDVFTTARVLFDYDYCARQHRQAITIDAPESRARYGAREITYEYPHIHAARLALELAQNRLTRDAAACWQIDADIDTGTAPAAGQPQGGGSPLGGQQVTGAQGATGARVGAVSIRYGDAIDLNHPHLPAGKAIVTSVTKTGQSAKINALCWQPAQVTLARHSAAATPDSARPAYVYKDGVATFTILDDTGAPIPHAMVMLDGITGNRTNGRGEVSFKTPRGAHSLTVYADGFEPFTLDVVL